MNNNIREGMKELIKAILDAAREADVGEKTAAKVAHDTVENLIIRGVTVVMIDTPVNET